MEAPDMFVPLDLQIDPTTKAVSVPSTAGTAVEAEIQTLNTLHRGMVKLGSPNNVPLPPQQVQPQRSQQIGKLKDSGNAAFRKGNHAEAVRMYSLAIEMALTRPSWEAQGLVREESAALFANRAQAYMGMREWADGLIDAEASLEMKKPQNAKAWWRKARCLMEMGRLEEARQVVEAALDWEPEPDLLGLKKEVDGLIEKKIRQ